MADPFLEAFYPDADRKQSPSFSKHPYIEPDSLFLFDLSNG